MLTVSAIARCELSPGQDQARINKHPVNYANSFCLLGIEIINAVPASVPFPLYVDGRMLGFGILADEDILLKRLNVRSLKSINALTWERIGLPAPSSIVRDRYGVNLTILLDSPVAMNSAQQRRFFYNMAGQWMDVFGRPCRLIGGPGDYVTVRNDVLTSPWARRYALDDLARRMGRRFKCHVPNIGQWTHYRPVIQTGWGFADAETGELPGVGRNRQPDDTITETATDRCSRGAATKNHDTVYINLLAIIWTLADSPHLSAQEIAVETGLTPNVVRDHLNREHFDKRLRAGCARTYEYAIGGENDQKHRALLGKAFRLMQRFAIYVLLLEPERPGATGAARVVPVPSHSRGTDAYIEALTPVPPQARGYSPQVVDMIPVPPKARGKATHVKVRHAQPHHLGQYGFAPLHMSAAAQPLQATANRQRYGDPRLACQNT